MMKIRIFGASGGVPCTLPPDKILKRGTCTSCYLVECGSQIIVIDAGTGIINAGIYLEPYMPLEIILLLTHLHWDHIQGIPFWPQIYNKGNKIEIYGGEKWDRRLEEVLKGQMHDPYFPISLEEVGKAGARIFFHPIWGQTELKFGNIKVKTLKLNHPDGCFGYRIECQKNVFVMATDTEPFGYIDQRLVDLAKNADLLVHDAEYFPNEYKGIKGLAKTGWGHSTPDWAAKTAKAAKVKKLLLTHHNLLHDDEAIDEIEKIAKAIFPNTEAAREGMVIEL